MTLILICCSQSRIYSYLCDPKSHRQESLLENRTLPARIKETINVARQSIVSALQTFFLN